MVNTLKLSQAFVIFLGAKEGFATETYLPRALVKWTGVFEMSLWLLFDGGRLREGPQGVR